MSRILNDLKVGAGMGKKIRDHSGDKLAGGCLEPRGEQIAQRDDGPAGWKFGNERGIDRVAEFGPSLEDPSLDRSRFATLQKRGNPSAHPFSLPFFARQMMFRNVKVNFHRVSPCQWFPLSYKTGRRMRTIPRGGS